MLHELRLAAKKDQSKGIVTNSHPDQQHEKYKGDWDKDRTQLLIQASLLSSMDCDTKISERDVLVHLTQLIDHIFSMTNRLALGYQLVHCYETILKDPTHPQIGEIIDRLATPGQFLPLDADMEVIVEPEEDEPEE